MKNANTLDIESFNQFIKTDEGKRGYVFSFKGEANTTFRSFFYGLFSFIFSRRITTISTYNEKAQKVITTNYVDRISNGLIERYPSETVKIYIDELNKVIQKENRKSWSAGTSKVIIKARLLQRANCYLIAIEEGYRNDEYLKDRLVKFKNPDNSITGAFSGAINGFFGLGGMLGFIITFGILLAVLWLVVFIVELF